MDKLCCVILALIAVAGCSRQPAVMTFVSDLHTPQVCGVLPSNTDMEIDSFAFYISGLEALIDGQWTTVDFLPSDQQTPQVALIDLRPVCGKSEQTQVHVPLAVSHHKFADTDKIRFTLGVPFTENHGNPVSLPPPLNLSTMFWSWQRGHKFIRFDLSHNTSGQQWMFHLGSIGCSADSALRAPSEPCTTPNLVTLEIDKTSDDGVVFVPAIRWLSGIDITDDTSCMFSVPVEASCAQLVDNVTSNSFRWIVR